MSLDSWLELERDLVIVACAISAGIPAALVPDHFDESSRVGGGFLAATVLLAGLVVASGLPLLHPEPESIDRLALVTKAIEALGLVAALHVIGRGRQVAASSLIHMKGVQT